MESLVAAIYDVQNFTLVKELIFQFGKEELEEQDADGLDLLHHAIIANYCEVVQLLLVKGTFVHPNQPQNGPPYLHLACLLGHSQLAYTLLEFRKSDFVNKVPQDKWLEWDKIDYLASGRASNKKDVSSFRSRVQKAGESKELLAVDVAAAAGHVKCVQMLLDSNFSPCTSRSALERAVELNSVRSVALLLAEEATTHVALHEACKSAVRRKVPECLALLLGHGVDPRKLFNGLNPYHVMYMYSSAFAPLGAKCRSDGLSDSTVVLVNGKMDVNSRNPVGSFPLYSLLNMTVYEKDSNPAQVPQQHIKALETLLKAGADTNFDEVAYAEKHSVSPNTLTVGRDLFTSALNAFFVSLQTSDTWRQFMEEHLDHCCQLLLEHGADPRYVDSYGETSLHDLMKLWAMQHAMGHMHVNLSRMTEMLLRFGADPNLQSTNGLYPVHHYFTILCNLMGGLFAFRRWLAAGNANCILRLLYFMDSDKALEASQNILTCCREVMPADMVNTLLASMNSITGAPKSLQLLCQLTVWDAVDRRAVRLQQLQLPRRFEESIVHMFYIGSQ